MVCAGASRTSRGDLGRRQRRRRGLLRCGCGAGAAACPAAPAARTSEAACRALGGPVKSIHRSGRQTKEQTLERGYGPSCRLREPGRSRIPEGMTAREPLAASHGPRTGPCRRTASSRSWSSSARAASRPEPGREDQLIEADHGHQQITREPVHVVSSCGPRGAAARESRESSSSAASRARAAAGARAITTSRLRRRASRARPRNHSRTRRFTRLRTTAPPTFRLTVIPRRHLADSLGAAARGATSTTKAPPAARPPLLGHTPELRGAPQSVGC